MNNKVTDFPQYRMLSNGKSFYKITNDRHFEEVKLVGTRVFKQEFTATQYPEILRIEDMLGGMDGIYLTIDEAEWEKTID
jgi:hypothetical protein